MCRTPIFLFLFSCLFSPMINHFPPTAPHPPLSDQTVGLSTPGPHKLGPQKIGERGENQDARRNERRRGGAARSSRSFSIPMEQKVNDGPHCVGRKLAGEVLQGITACTSEQRQKEAGHKLQVVFFTSWTIKTAFIKLLLINYFISRRQIVSMHV